MKKAVFVISVIACLSVITVCGQDNIGALKKAQKAVKNSLMKNSPSVYRVGFDGCNMSLRLSSGYSYSSGGTGGFVGGGFPQDGFSSAMSAGPDTYGISNWKLERYDVDLSLIPTSAVKISTSLINRYSRVVISDNGSIRKRISKKFETSPAIAFSIKTNAAGSFETALADLIGVCSATK